jgi:hypothetical protein
VQNLERWHSLAETALFHILLTASSWPILALMAGGMMAIDANPESTKLALKMAFATFLNKQDHRARTSLQKGLEVAALVRSQRPATSKAHPIFEHGTVAREHLSAFDRISFHKHSSLCSPRPSVTFVLNR